MGIPVGHITEIRMTGGQVVDLKQPQTMIQIEMEICELALLTL
jgi:hypothetical protein